MELSDVLITYTYAVYLFISIALTVWVAHTLHKNGRVFLVRAFNGHTELADSVNHLLVVGFYLINIGFVSMVLKEDVRPQAIPTVIELLSKKIGMVLLVLGGMHFFNLAIFSNMKSETHPQPAPRPAGPGPHPIMGTGR